MSIKCYMAMTGEEFSACEKLPANIAWMACHFSCYGAELSNLPHSLPKNSMVIVDDSTPLQGHDPHEIAQQLTTLAETLCVSHFLLDFQRPDNAQTFALAKHLLQTLPCPVGVTDHYAKDLNCPVFLPPPPLDMPLEKFLNPWIGREIWLEAAPACQTITITKDGSKTEPQPLMKLSHSFENEDLYCSYNTDIQDDRAIFCLLRNNDTLYKMLDAAQQFGVSLAVGLYQQLQSSQRI